MIFEARNDSRVAIVEPGLKAFRSIDGAWTPRPPGGSLIVEEIEADFIEVKDAARADSLRAEAKSKLAEV